MMGASAKTPERSGSPAFEIDYGANSEWIVRGPEDKWGGLFVSREAAEAFARREARRMPGAEGAKRLPRPKLTLVRSGREPSSAGLAKTSR